MSSVTCHRYGDCIGILELSSRYVPSPDREVENALQMLERDFSFTTYEAVSLLKEAVDWGFDRATWHDERKINFLLKLMQGNREDFLKTVLDAYNIRSGKVDARGKCGYELGSSEYLRHLEKQVFLQELPSRSGEDYARILRESLGTIARQLKRDLSISEKENNYITESTALSLHISSFELSRCGLSGVVSDEDIDCLAWFVEGNSSHILGLQKRLNKVAWFKQLTKDGVYGKKTAETEVLFIDRIKGHLEEFLLNKDAVAAAAYIISADLNLRCAKMARTPWVTDEETKTNLVRILFDNRKIIQRFVWKWGAENYLRPNGYDVAAFMLEHSLENSPSPLYCPQTHWITRKIINSIGFHRAFYSLRHNLLKNPSQSTMSGAFDINFGLTGDRDLYYSIGRCTMKYVAKKIAASFQLDFTMEDDYDFSEIRTLGGDEKKLFAFDADFGSLANDAGLFSQADGVISNYKIYVSFSKFFSI